MTKLILISHGKLAEGMAFSACMIGGHRDSIETWGLMPGGDVETDVIQPVRKTVEDHPEVQYLILSDLFCGSVYNASYALKNEKNVLIGTGMNLSLVLNLIIKLDQEWTAESFRQEIEDSRQYTKVMPELDTGNTSSEDFFE